MPATRCTSLFFALLVNHARGYGMLPDDVTLENVGGTDTTQAFFGQEGGPGRAVVLGGTAELIECVDPGDFDTQKSLQKPTKYKATATKKSTKAERFHKKHSPIATQCCLDSECHREYTNAGDHPDNLGVIVPLDGLGTVLSPGGPFGCYSGTDAGRITAHTYNEAKEICKNQAAGPRKIVAVNTTRSLCGPTSRAIRWSEEGLAGDA